MGKILSRMKRPFRNYNVENRAHKIISKDKPVPAPKYETDRIEIDRLMNERQDDFLQTLQKDEHLDKNLKNVFVTSTKVLNEHKVNPKRPLPSNRSSYEEPVFGIVEPEKVGKGKVTLINALKFITNHHANSTLYSAASIAKEYSLPEESVRKILRYCKTFEVYIPQNKHSKVNFAGPTIKRMKIITKPLKQIDTGEQTKGDTKE
ncbi:hypothetical protein HHI36_012747 [Cryptolaemus montrouzieri]|uniref:Uncharacterized protein n=1 Tax=Cryptolaemus montrouzieri TaxID=559131 RepID=A0ABD2NF53_9CUCU